MKNKKRMTVMALALASVMFAACGNSAETGNAPEAQEEPVVTESTEEESFASETEDSADAKDVAMEETETAETENEENVPVREVDARMAHFIEVAKGYGADSMNAQFQDFSMPQPDGIKVSSIDATLSSFFGLWAKDAIGAVRTSFVLESEEAETEEEQDAEANSRANGTQWGPVEGEMRPGYVEFESVEAAANAFQGIQESYTWVHGWEEVEVTDTRQLHLIQPSIYNMYQLHENAIYTVNYSFEGDKERAGQLIEELILY